MGVTIKDVAKYAGVAHGTVSRYLNGYELSPENQEKVEAAIQALDYKVNYAARALKSNSTFTVGVIVRSLVDFFETSIATVIQDELEKRGYTAIICSCNNSTDTLSQKLELLETRGIDGIIAFPPCGSGTVLARYAERVPVVAVDEQIQEPMVDSVTVDNYDAAFRATMKLIEAGHTSIGILANFESSQVAQDRLNGYLDALRQAGLPILHRNLADGHFTLKEGFAMAQHLMRGEDHPTALLITNYYMAMGAISALESMNYRIPDDVSVISFDYFEPYDNATVALTCVVQPIEKLGQQAACRLLERMRDRREWQRSDVILPTTLLERKSVSYLK